MEFRKDINGLRAFAVIAVVLFHFNSAWLPGGFAGVDVFFVISGFLMTSIIFRGIEQNSFSVMKFYVARANRIIPALALLCAVLLVGGWFYLTPVEYQALGKHAASSVGFLSNFVYLTEAGYFDASSHEKWLLHTWSLSVEWQFYIIYPLILLALRKFMSINTMKIAVVIGTVVGFVFCVWATYKYPSASYYLFPTRAWEMMIGGVAYLYPFTMQKNRKKVVEWIGLALIIGSCFFISATDPWPGYLAIFPVLGSFLIIQAQRNDSIITDNVIFQKIGSWSYSIYLWHWPLVVIIYTLNLPIIYAYFGMALSVLLGYLSYKYVEKIRFASYKNFKSLFASKPIYIALIMGIIGSTLFVKSGAITHYRLTDEQISIVEQQKRDPREPKCGKVVAGVSPQCTYGSGPVKAIIIGDSHSQAQNVAIGERASLKGGSILSLGLSGCATVKDIYRVDATGANPNHNCGKMVANAIKVARDEYPNTPVIIINRLSTYIHGRNEDMHPAAPDFFVDKVFAERNDDYFANLTSHMLGTICEISESNPVYLMRPTPELGADVPKTLFRNLTIFDSKGQVKITRAEYNERQSIAFAMQDKAVKQCGAKVLDPSPYLCDSVYCYGDVDGIPMYFDDNHLSSAGAARISSIYDEIFN